MRLIESAYATASWLWWAGAGLLAVLAVRLTATFFKPKPITVQTRREQLEVEFEAGDITRREYEAMMLEMYQ